MHEVDWVGEAGKELHRATADYRTPPVTRLGRRDAIMMSQHVKRNRCIAIAKQFAKFTFINCYNY